MASMPIALSAASQGLAHKGRHLTVQGCTMFQMLRLQFPFLSSIVDKVKGLGNMFAYSLNFVTYAVADRHTFAKV